MNVRRCLLTLTSHCLILGYVFPFFNPPVEFVNIWRGHVAGSLAPGKRGNNSVIWQQKRFRKTGNRRDEKKEPWKSFPFVISRNRAYPPPPPVTSSPRVYLFSSLAYSFSSGPAVSRKVNACKDRISAICCSCQIPHLVFFCLRRFESGRIHLNPRDEYLRLTVRLSSRSFP